MDAHFQVNAAFYLIKAPYALKSLLEALLPPSNRRPGRLLGHLRYISIHSNAQYYTCI